eukprot:COSAG02_NODE_30383_length_552_cov_0.856512_1_plen_72_part_10
MSAQWGEPEQGQEHEDFNSDELVSAVAVEKEDAVCGTVLQHTGGGAEQKRVAKYPEGLAVGSMAECCGLCKP